MTMQELKIFEEKQIRTIWDEVQEKWYFCVADVISALSDSTDVKQYTKRLRQRDPELNSVWGTICTPHQFISTDGKKHAVNCATMEGVFRIVQSIPSKKAEPFKRWLAQVGAERIQQMQDPELGIQQSFFLRHISDCHKALSVVDNAEPCFLNRYGTVYSIQYINRRFKEIKRKYALKIENFSTHSLRKTFGRKVVESAGMDAEMALIRLSELFNHRDVATTRRYLGLRQSELLETYDLLDF